MFMMRSTACLRSGKRYVRLIRKVAIDAALAAGATIRKSYGNLLQVDKTLPHDLKLRLDRTCEERILTAIRRRFPAHGVLSEEIGYAPGVDPFLWIVDPMDGTVNFFHEIPFFCTCVSCHKIKESQGIQGEILLPDGRAVGSALVSVVYRPVGEELFTGFLDGGAYLNGRLLHLEHLADLSLAIASLSFGAQDGSVAYIGRLLPRMVQRAQKVRSFGSTALDIAYVAAGRVGAFVQMGTNLWDFAAAAAILKEAGGILEAEEYTRRRWKVVAGNPGTFAEVRMIAEGALE